MKISTTAITLLCLVAMLDAAKVTPQIRLTGETQALLSSHEAARQPDAATGAYPGKPKVSPAWPGTDDSLWINAGTVPGVASCNGLKVYGNQIWLASGSAQQIKIIDRLTGASIRSIPFPATLYPMGLARFGVNNESLAIACYYPSNIMYIGDTLGNWPRSFTPPSGYACRGLDWDGSKFWVADVSSPQKIYTMDKTGTLLRTLTVSGGLQIPGWFMDITLDRLFPNRLWALDNSPIDAYYVSFDTSANTYTVRAVFSHPDAANNPEGMGFWADGVGNGYCYTNSYYVSRISKIQVHRVVLAHDAGASSIVNPQTMVAPGSAVAPIVWITNYGSNPESDIPVTCWIDSGGTRVYTSNVFTCAGPLAPGASVACTLAPNWTIGAMNNTYRVTAFTSLSGDLFRGNDTAVCVVTSINPPCRYFEPEWTLPNDGHTIYAACVVHDSLLWVAQGYHEPDRILIYRIRDLALIDSFIAPPESSYGYLDFYYHASEDVVYAPSGNGLDRWDATTHAYLGQVPIGAYAGAVSGEGDSLYLTGFGTGIFKCATDGSNLHEVSSAPPLASVIGLAVDSSRSLLFCTSSYSPPDHMFEFDMLTWTLVLDTILLPHSSDWGGCELFHGDTFLVAVVQDPDDEVHCYRLIPAHAGVAADNGPLRTTDCHLRVAPNPSTGAALISFSLPRPGIVNLKLFRVTGAEVMTLATGYHKAGAYSFTPSFSHTLARGVYLLRLETEHSAFEQKLILE